ncbi:MAG TPA: hypothetical protein DCQ98_04815 [Planctomycetaceae bacterium]|nr:hypothetical protein [Planctomycetaceae bacterium]
MRGSPPRLESLAREAILPRSAWWWNPQYGVFRTAGGREVDRGGARESCERATCENVEAPSGPDRPKTARSERVRRARQRDGLVDSGVVSDGMRCEPTLVAFRPPNRQSMTSMRQPTPRIE